MERLLFYLVQRIKEFVIAIRFSLTMRNVTPREDPPLRYLTTPSVPCGKPQLPIRELQVTAPGAPMLARDYVPN